MYFLYEGYIVHSSFLRIVRLSYFADEKKENKNGPSSFPAQFCVGTERAFFYNKKPRSYFNNRGEEISTRYHPNSAAKAALIASNKASAVNAAMRLALR